MVKSATPLPPLYTAPPPPRQGPDPTGFRGLIFGFLITPLLKLNFSFIKEFRLILFSNLHIFVHIVRLSDICEELVAGTLRREKVFSDEFFHGH